MLPVLLYNAMFNTSPILKMWNQLIINTVAAKKMLHSALGIYISHSVELIAS